MPPTQELAAANAASVADATVKIPVKIVKGRVTYLYGKQRPPIRDGAIGDLVLAASDILDARWIQPLIEEKPVQILSAGTTVLLAVRLKKIPRDKYDRLFQFDAQRGANLFLDPVADESPAAYPSSPTLADDAKYWTDWAFVAIDLLEPLDLLLRGTKQAVLQPARCQIGALSGRIAESLNHAYTLVSETFEPDRRSHTGNVFERARYHDGTHWRLLRDLRNEHEAAYETVLINGTRMKKEPVAEPVDERQGTLDFS